MSLKVGQTVTLNVHARRLAYSEQLSIDFDSRRPSIDNSDSLVDGVIESREVESLPLNGRNFLELALLIPGNSSRAEFRSDENQYRRHLFGRSTRTRRQCNHRRRRH